VTEGVYSLFEVRPDAAGKLQRRRRARFHIKDAQVTHLEDLDDELSGVPEGPLTPESATAIRKLSGPHRQLVRWTPEYGDDPGHLPEFTPPKPFVPAESGPTSRPPVFEYHRQGMDRPHTVEVRGDGVVLNGSALSPQESMKLLDNVRSGVGTLRYKRVGEGLAEAGSHVIKKNESEDQSREDVPEPPKLDRDTTVPAAGNLEALASKEPTGIPAFVEVNDLWRHLQAGWTETDEALRELGEVLRSSGGDPYRISDDLFLVFYPDSETMMTGLREASEPERVLRPAGLDPLTLAIGAGRDQDEAWEQLQTARRLARQEPGHPQSLVRVAQDLVKTELAKARGTTIPKFDTPQQLGRIYKQFYQADPYRLHYAADMAAHKVFNHPAPTKDDAVEKVGTWSDETRVKPVSRWTPWAMVHVFDNPNAKPEWVDHWRGVLPKVQELWEHPDVVALAEHHRGLVQQQTAQEALDDAYEAQGQVPVVVPGKRARLKADRLVWLWHGTSDKFIPHILEHGLEPAQQHGNIVFDPREGGRTRTSLQHVYLTSNPGSPAGAEFYANAAAHRHGGAPAKIRLLAHRHELSADMDDRDLSSGAWQYRAPRIPVERIMEINGKRVRR